MSEELRKCRFCSSSTIILSCDIIVWDGKKYKKPKFWTINHSCNGNSNSLIIKSKTKNEVVDIWNRIMNDKK